MHHSKIRRFLKITCFATIVFLFFIAPIFSQEKCIIWLTGLPCSGKTTLAKEFHTLYPKSIMLDGDEFRKSLNKDLGFSEEDRKENLRRIVAVGKIISESTDYIIISAVSPKEEWRKNARDSFEQEGYRFLEVFVNASLDVCIQRDVKGMYKEAIEGRIKFFTGISAPYDLPSAPDVICYTSKETIHESVQKIISAIELP